MTEFILEINIRCIILHSWIVIILLKSPFISDIAWDDAIRNQLSIQLPGTRPTTDISIEFTIHWNFTML